MTIVHDSPSFDSFVGVDLHKCTVTLAAADAQGSDLGTLTCDTKCMDRIERWLLSLPQPIHLAVEACPFVEWFIDHYRPIVEEPGGRLDIADATELSNRRGKRRKNDRKDARDIAARLARGDCPLGWIADGEIAHLRKLGRHWRSLSRSLSRAKHSLKSMLNAANIRGPKFDGASAQKWLLAHGGLLKPAAQMAFSDHLDLILQIERMRSRLHRQIIAANRGEGLSQMIQRLRSVPGIDQVWACIIAAEVGDFSRFPNADTIEFWSGLTPDNQESAGRTTSGSITKAGSATLRWALCNAAMCLCRSDDSWQAVRERLRGQIGKPKTNVALGRRLLRVLYAMMRDGQDYRRGAGTEHTAKANQARMAKRQKEKARA